MGAPENVVQFQPINLTVALGAEHQQHLAAAEAVVAEAESLTIDCPPMAEYANTFLKDLKTRRARIAAMETDICGPIKLSLANAVKWFKPSIDAHDRAETIVKARLQDFTRKEAERIALEDRARRDAERKAREEAEQQAAATRARAEESARKAREEAAAAEARRKAEEEIARKARESGDKRAAAEAEKRAQAAAAEKAKKEEEERQRLAEGERRAIQAQLEAAAAAQAAAAAAPRTERTELKGFGERKNWIAELADDTDEDRAKALIVEAIVGGRRDLLALIALDMKAATKLAKAQEKNFSVPGLKARNDPTSYSRK